VYLGVAGGGTTGEQPRTGGGVGVTGEVGFHLARSWALALTGGAFHSVDSSFLQGALVMHRSFADELFSVGVGLGAFTVPGLATNGVLVPVELDVLPLFFHEGRPLFGLGIKLQVAPGVDLGTGRFALAARRRAARRRAGGGLTGDSLRYQRCVGASAPVSRSRKTAATSRPKASVLTSESPAVASM
jgi:hypothetical protein